MQRTKAREGSLIGPEQGKRRESRKALARPAVGAGLAAQNSKDFDKLQCLHICVCIYIYIYMYNIYIYIYIYICLSICAYRYIYI